MNQSTNQKIKWLPELVRRSLAAHCCILLLSHASALSQIVVLQSDTTRLPEVTLGEVEIISMRESGRLSRLPLSAGVLDLQQIQRNQVHSLKTASHFVANLFMPDYGSRLTSPVYIRGIGSRINAPSVGLYVDNIPYFEKSVFDFDLLNAERIEVLRGPQGTLYGRNTMGGLINVYSQSPFRSQGTEIAVTGGNPVYLNGMLSHRQMLSSELGIAVGGGVNRHNGFFRNEFLDEMADAHLSAGGRIRLSWQVSTALTAELTAHVERLDQGGYPYAIHNPGSGETLPVSYNEPSSYERQIASGGLVLNYQTARIRVQAVSALQHFDDVQGIDQDFTPADLVFAVQKQNQLMLSQELTARSEHDRNYQWVVGAFAFSQALDNDLGIRFGQDAVNMGLVPGLLTRNQLSANTVAGAALFHQSALRNFLLRDLTLTAGLRLDYETATLNHEAYMEAEFQTPSPAGFESDLRFTEWLPRLALNYELTQGTSLYAALVRGYKTGGFNVVFEREEDRSFDPEHSWNYELGFRGRFWDERISIQSAVFYIDWKNQQIYQMLPSGQGSMLKNAGASVSKGVELDLQALLTPNLQWRASYGYTHATFRENSPTPDTDLLGNFIPYVPRYTLYSGLDYRIPLRSGTIRALRLGLNCQGVGEHFWNDANSVSQKPYALLNGMVSVETGHLVLDVFVNNITSTGYHSFSFAALGNHYVQPGRPTTFGMNLRYSF